MITVLFYREFSSLPIFSKGSRTAKWLYLVLVLISAALCVGIEVFAYREAFNLLSPYQGASLSLTAILLSLLSLAGAIAILPRVASSFFDSRERRILGPAPVRPTDVFFAKAAFFYCLAFAYVLLLIFPVAICYGVLAEAYFPYYLYSGVFCFIFPLLILGLSFLFAPIYRLLSKAIQKNMWVLLAFSFLLMIGLGYLYSILLNLFIDLVLGNSLSYLLTTEFIGRLNAVGNALYPFAPFLRLAHIANPFSLFSLSAIVPIACFAFFSPLLYVFFSRFYAMGEKPRGKRKRSYFRGLRSPIHALLSKEFLVLSSSSDGVLSFFSLVLASPFLSVSVVHAIGVIFHTGNLNFISNLFPGWSFFIQVATIFLFLFVINGAGGLSLEKEGRRLSLLKTFPISPKAQLRSKIALPLFWGFLAYAASLLSLSILGDVSWPAFPFLLLSGAFFLASIYLYSALTGLSGLRQSKMAYLKSLFFLLPFIFAGIPALLTLLDGFSGLSPYLLLLGLSLCLFIPSVILFEAKSERAFLSFEGGAA